VIDLQKLSGLELQNLLRSFKCGTEPIDGTFWHEAVEEARRRGIRLLKELGYPTGEKAILRNTYAGIERTLFDITTDEGDFLGPDTHYATYEEALTDEVPFIICHWKPAIGPNVEAQKEAERESIREARANGNKCLVQFV